MTQRCRVPDEDLIMYSDGLLLEGRREIVEAHLGACPSCQARLARYRDVDRLIQDECGDSSFSLGQRAVLRRRLADEASRDSRFTTYRPGKMIPGLVVAILLALIVYPQTTLADFPWAHLVRFAEVNVTGSLPQDLRGPITGLIGSSNEKTSLEFTPIAPTELPFGFLQTEQSIVDPEHLELFYRSEIGLSMLVSESGSGATSVTLDVTGPEWTSVQGTEVLIISDPRPGAVAAFYWERNDVFFQVMVVESLGGVNGGLSQTHALTIVEAFIAAQDAP